jgi:chromate transporter
MPPVYPPSADGGARLVAALPALIESASMHVGAAASAASLRGRLVEQGFVDEAQFDQCFAVARLTPGTNLLALFALLGSHVAGWRGALVALALGTAVPGLIATVIAAVYVRHASAPLVVYAMAGAKAAAFAVFLWAVVRLSRPVLRQQRRRGVAFTIVVATAAVTGHVPPFVLLLGAGALGAWWLRPQS